MLSVQLDNTMGVSFNMIGLPLPLEKQVQEASQSPTAKLQQYRYEIKALGPMHYSVNEKSSKGNNRRCLPLGTTGQILTWIFLRDDGCCSNSSPWIGQIQSSHKRPSF